MAFATLACLLGGWAATDGGSGGQAKMADRFATAEAHIQSQPADRFSNGPAEEWPDGESGSRNQAHSAAAADQFFAPDKVLDISIQMAPAEWDELRLQTRHFRELIREIQTYNLSRPFSKPFTWFEATVSVDGELHSRVGIRKKGFLGSLDDDKPSLKLRFDRFVEDRALGGVIERMTLNNSKQDASFLNSCLAYQLFAQAGIPAPRCNFARVSVNGKFLGLYIHVEEIEHHVVPRAFTDGDGNLYEGTISDFTPQLRGTFEKETNSKENDWSDIDAVVAALQDPTENGLQDLARIVDLNSFLTYWAVEVLIGSHDGYAGNRNNFHIYRERDGRFVFLPWGPDQAFATTDGDWDEFVAPQSVLAHGALAHRLYHEPAWRTAYLDRLRSLLHRLWDERALTLRVGQMAAVVEANAAPAERAAAAADTDRIRAFVERRRSEILGELAKGAPEWPGPWRPIFVPRFPHQVSVTSNRFVAAPGNPDLAHNIPNLEVSVDGQVRQADFLAYYDSTGGLARWGYPTSEVIVIELGTLTQFYQRGAVDFHDVGHGWLIERRLAWDYVGGGLDGAPDQRVEPPGMNPHPGAVVGPWGHKVSNLAVDGTRTGFADFFHAFGGVASFGYPKTAARVDTGGSGSLFDPRTTPGFIRQYYQAAVFEYHPQDPSAPVKLTLLGDSLRDFLLPEHQTLPAFRAATPLRQGARLDPAVIGPVWPPVGMVAGDGTTSAADGLVINEVAAKGDPMDWFELYNASNAVIDLSGFLVADDLIAARKRVPFPPGSFIQPGQYLQFQLNKDAWPGFALGGDEELGIWTADGDLVDAVDWEEGQSGAGQSFARVPDAVGGFRTVELVTPGRPNPDR